ncbi:hypothetical protein SLS64_014318 [Diaporthe eres]
MADVATPDSVAANSPNGGGARIGRPPQWTESRSRKLARLYMYTTLPMEKIIKALFPNDDVKKNSAQKTLHKMVGHDPRPLRPVDRNDMNTRFKLLHKRSQRRRQSDGTPIDQEDRVVAGLKEELATPAFSEVSRLAVPGDFMISRKYMPQCHAQKHFATSSGEGGVPCWCTIADETADLPEAFYITDRGADCDRAASIRQGSADASSADQFGNTPLHLFAAWDNQIGIETTFQLLESGRADPSKVNSAHQTFLHVLSPMWFFGTNDLSVPLYRLLNFLYARHKNLIYAPMSSVIENITQHYWSAIPRDAFDVKPPSHATDTSFAPPRRTGTTALSPLAEEAPEEDFTSRDMGLVSIVNEAYNNPVLEDNEGRNGLHCLAEMPFITSNPSSPDPNTPNPSQPPNTNTKGSLKRKHGRDDAERIKPITQRLSVLSGLLTPVKQTAPPDVNHYDHKGNTVLIAFAGQLSDDQDDKSGQHIGRILDLLIDNGAILDARNRQGETALLVAAKRGNKHVVSKLLDKGANLHARDKRGRAIMAIIDAQIALCSKDLPSYGRLEAVRAAVLAKKLEEKGVEDEPTFVDEWTWPSRRQT